MLSAPPQLTGAQELAWSARGLGWRRLGVRDGGKSRQDGRTLGLRVRMCPVSGSLAGPSEGVPAPANPILVWDPAALPASSQTQSGRPKASKGSRYETQVHTHAHTAQSHAHMQLAHTHIHTRTHTGTFTVHSCTHMHTHLHTHPNICTRTLPERQGLQGSWVQSGGLITSHSPRPARAQPKWLVKSHDAAAVPKPP